MTTIVNPRDTRGRGIMRESVFIGWFLREELDTQGSKEVHRIRVAKLEIPEHTAPQLFSKEELEARIGNLRQFGYPHDTEARVWLSWDLEGRCARSAHTN